MDERSNIGKNIGVLCRQLNLFINHELEKYDITASEIMYLQSLILKDDVSQDELSREFGVDKAAVARTISSLEAKGLVIRENSAIDKRSKHVRITKKAAEYKDLLQNITDKWYKEAFAFMDEKTMKTFSRDLEMITSNTRKLNER